MVAADLRLDGPHPDYKAAFGSALGANPGFYGRFEDNAKTWYKRIQEACLYLNHAIVNPPIDRDKPVDQVKDVFISVDEEVDGGIVVSGAKVVATNSALTHYNFVGQGSAQLLGDNTDFALMFIAPMNTGMKLICRPPTNWWRVSPDRRSTTHCPAVSTRTTRSW